MFILTRIDSEFDVLAPDNQPENAIYIALDTFCWITILMATFVSTVLDTKLLLFALRTQVEVQRSFQETENRSSSSDLRYGTYDETLTRALNEMFHSYITTLFDND